jgi:hypothetical protein
MFIKVNVLEEDDDKKQISVPTLINLNQIECFKVYGDKVQMVYIDKDEDGINWRVDLANTPKEISERLANTRLYNAL